MEQLIKLSDNNSNITIKKIGAELISYIFNNKEYIWNKKEFWAKSSPILFPIIGQLKDRSYIYSGVEYKDINGHGFAKDKEFEIVEKNENTVLFKLKFDKETYKIYPFKFELYIKYTLKANKLKIEYTVKNIDDKDIYFSLGAHPGFVLDNYEKSKIIFEKEEYSKDFIVGEDALLHGEKEIFNDENRNYIVLNDDAFSGNTIILKELNSKYLYLEEESRRLKFYFGDFKYLAFWRKLESPYICIEPWDGIPDYFDTNRNFEEKIGNIKLEKNKIYNREIEIEILK